MGTISIPQTQRAAVFDKVGGPVYIKEIPVVQPNELKQGQILVKVVYSGVCHTDLHAMKGDWPMQGKFPRIGGHEGVGYIAAIAQHTSTRLKVGERVGIKWLATTCLQCEFCRKGEEAVCPSAENHGYTCDGSFQQYAVSWANHVTKIPPELPLHEAAPYLCAGLTVYKALRSARLDPTEIVALPGAGGGLGHLAVQYANSLGYTVLAIDTGPEKESLCKALGAKEFIDFKKTPDLYKEIREKTDNLGPHAAVVAAAGAAAYQQALEYVRAAGTLVAVGMPGGAVIKAEVFSTIVSAKRIVGSYVGNRQDAVEAMEFAARGKVRTTSQMKTLDELPEVYKMMDEGTLTGRVVIDLGHKDK